MAGRLQYKPNTMLNDLRYAIRTLRHQPGFVLVAICSLAIGIGANTAIYSFADARMLRPIPVREPSRVVDITASKNGDIMASTALSYPDYLDLRGENRTFSGLVASSMTQFGVAPDRGAQPQMRFGMFVSGNFFNVLGVTPELGRVFGPPEDKTPGRDAVVVLSHDLWVSDFVSDPHVVGRRIVINGTNFTVSGVAPERFPGLDIVKSALYVPIAMSAALSAPESLTDRARRWIDVRGRLKDGVGITQAQADVARIVHNLRRTYKKADSSLGLKVETEFQMRSEQSPPDTMLVLMLGLLAICVLLVACANVAGLLIGKAATRAREIAVRVAIGAKQRTLVGQLLIESSLLAMSGGAAGLAIGWAACRFFNTVPLPSDLPINFHAQLDHRALTFTMTVAIASTILFGLTPALRGTRVDLNSALKERSGTASRTGRLWGRSALVTCQVALSVLLLIVSAVLVQGFRSELGRGPGFRVNGIQLMSFDTGLMHYTDAQRDRFYKQLQDGVRQLPGIYSAALLSVVPLGLSNYSVGVTPQGKQLKQGERPPYIMANAVSSGYFSTFDIPILTGRPFADSDRADTPAVAIVNDIFARHYWPNQDPLGKTLRLNDSGKEVHIVGIAKTTKYIWIAEAPMDFVYLPVAQNPASDLTLAVRASKTDPASLVPELDRLVHGLDPNMPIYGTQTMSSMYHMRAVETPQYLIKTVTALGAMALILSCIGLYGIISYGVSRRTREFGVRLAVGARQQQVTRMVLRDGLRLGLVGTFLGLVLGLMVTSLLESQILFSFQHIGAFPYVAVCALLVVTVCVSGYGPAYRASRTDPLRALREE